MKLPQGCVWCVCFRAGDMRENQFFALVTALTLLMPHALRVEIENATAVGFLNLCFGFSYPARTSRSQKLPITFSTVQQQRMLVTLSVV